MHPDNLNDPEYRDLSQVTKTDYGAFLWPSEEEAKGALKRAADFAQARLPKLQQGRWRADQGKLVIPEETKTQLERDLDYWKAKAKEFETKFRQSKPDLEEI